MVDLGINKLFYDSDVLNPITTHPESLGLTVGARHRRDFTITALSLYKVPVIL